MRITCYQILKELLDSHIHLNLRLKSLKLNEEQMRQITIRTYGFLQKREYLEFQVWNLTEKKKLDQDTLLVLCMAMYEHLFLDSIPDYAIISEYQNLSKKVNLDGQTYVAYVLSNRLKTYNSITPSFKDEIKNLSITYSLPKPLVKVLSQQYPNNLIDLLGGLADVKNISARVVNPLINPNDFTSFEFDDLVISNKNMVRSEDFIANNIMIQDLGSYLVTKYLDPQKDDCILDICAAPGSKTLHIAKYCSVVANEINLSRLKVLERNLEKYQITNVKLLNQDAKEFEYHQKFQKILVDAPCSGLGCLASKPEIKYYYNLKDQENIIQLQQDIFGRALEYLDVDGEIVYSTCSINKNENQKQVEYFCKKYDLEVVSNHAFDKYNGLPGEVGVTLLPTLYKTDGFYMCKLKRKNNDKHL